MLLMEVSLSQYHSVLQSFMLTNVTYEYFDYGNVTYAYMHIHTKLRNMQANSFAKSNPCCKSLFSLTNSFIDSIIKQFDVKIHVSIEKFASMAEAEDFISVDDVKYFPPALVKLLQQFQRDLKTYHAGKMTEEQWQFVRAKTLKLISSKLEASQEPGETSRISSKGSSNVPCQYEKDLDDEPQ